MSDPLGNSNATARAAIEAQENAKRLANPLRDGSVGAAQANAYEARPERTSFWQRVAAVLNPGSQ